MQGVNPEWHQTLVFMKLARAELASRSLEITTWHYDRFKANEFLGEVVMSLSGTRALASVAT